MIDLIISRVQDLSFLFIKYYRYKQNKINVISADLLDLKKKKLDLNFKETFDFVTFQLW